VTPKTSLNVCPPAANSGMFVLPRVITPAARIRSITRSSVSGTNSALASDPKVVRMPAVRWLSWCATGTPCRVRRKSRGGPVVRFRGLAQARAQRWATMALTTGLTASIRSRCAVTTFRALICLARSRPASSVADR